MILKLLAAFVFGAVAGGAVVAWYARRMIQRIRTDWRTANAVRERSPL